MTTILITGGTGLVGQYLQKKLVDKIKAYNIFVNNDNDDQEVKTKKLQIIKQGYDFLIEHSFLIFSSNEFNRVIKILKEKYDVERLE